MTTVTNTNLNQSIKYGNFLLTVNPSARNDNALLYRSTSCKLNEESCSAEMYSQCSWL